MTSDSSGKKREPHLKWSFFSLSDCGTQMQTINGMMKNYCSLNKRKISHIIRSKNHYTYIITAI